MRKSSLRSVTREHLMAGDTPQKHAERIALMAQNPRRAGSVVRMAALLHSQLGDMARNETGLHASTTGYPRMNVRNIGDKLYGLAHKWHCHAGAYRTRGAADLLARGGLTLEEHAVTHCEHTIPSSLVADLLWRKRDQGAFETPMDLLAWLLRHSIVTVALQSERKEIDGQPVHLDRMREIEGIVDKWTCTHPDLQDDADMTDAVRPFLRYKGTGAEIVHWPTGDVIDIETYTMADHAARMATCPLHDIKTYIPRETAVAA